jgi:hypothetical protein
MFQRWPSFVAGSRQGGVGPAVAANSIRLLQQRHSREGGGAPSPSGLG